MVNEDPRLIAVHWRATRHEWNRSKVCKEISTRDEIDRLLFFLKYWKGIFPTKGKFGAELMINTQEMKQTDIKTKLKTILSPEKTKSCARKELYIT